ncbi:MAG: hypothetical protein ACI3Y0_00945 [Prevotella sp.]
MKKNDLDQLIKWLENGEYSYKYHGKKMSDGMQAQYARYIKEDFYNELLGDEYDTAEDVLNKIDDSYNCKNTDYLFPNGRDDE